MKKGNEHIVLVVAPHPDDETLGCAGTLLKLREMGYQIHWLIFTKMTPKQGYNKSKIQKRQKEIKKVFELYNFQSVTQLDFPTTMLDSVPMSNIVATLGPHINEICPQTVFLPYRNDVHSDHTVVFDAVISCTKSFRYQSVKNIYAYETLSETDYGLRPDDNGFKPNLFVGIEKYLKEKFKIMKCYEGEMGKFPFPRSKKSIEALARFRGSQSGSQAAEAFMILKEIR